MVRLHIEPIVGEATCTELCKSALPCGRPARYVVGFKDSGEPMCLRHARQHALADVLGASCG